MWEQVESLARCLRAVSVGTRIKILCLLKRQALCVGAITTRLGITQGAVSQHLRVLREAGLIESERHGCHIHYRQLEGALLSVREALEQVLRCEQDVLAEQTAGPRPNRTRVSSQDCARSINNPRLCRSGKTGKCHGARNQPCLSKANRK